MKFDAMAHWRRIIRRIDDTVESQTKRLSDWFIVADPDDVIAARVWSTNASGEQGFHDATPLVFPVFFPSDKLAKRVAEWAGGHVIRVSEFLARQRRFAEDRLKALQ